MTYADLLQALKEMTPEALTKDLTIHVDGEYYPAELMMSDDEDDVLGEEHPYFKIKDEA
jgi:hypothetical protein